MRLAVVASGWHYPIQFYKEISNQHSGDKFCISHRFPRRKGAILGEGLRKDLDRVLYRECATQGKIEALGWVYEQHPNTIGDWGCSNQWIETHNWQDYDAYLFTHDDNFILPGFIDEGLKRLKEADIVTNSVGRPEGWLRGSCEFFTKEALERIGGKFDLSKVTLTREGQNDDGEIEDWNNTIHPTMEAIKREGLQVDYLSPYYRVSRWCIEGERGFIHKTQPQNTPYEEQGLKEYLTYIRKMV